MINRVIVHKTTTAALAHHAKQQHLRAIPLSFKHAQQQQQLRSQSHDTHSSTTTNNNNNNTSKQPPTATATATTTTTTTTTAAMMKSRSQFWDNMSTDYSQSFFGTFAGHLTHDMIQMSHILSEIKQYDQSESSQVDAKSIKILDLGAGTGALCHSLIHHLGLHRSSHVNESHTMDHQPREQKRQQRIIFDITATDLSQDMIHLLNQSLQQIYHNNNNESDKNSSSGSSNVLVQVIDQPSTNNDIDADDSHHQVVVRIRSMVANGMDMKEQFANDTFDYIFCNFVLIFFPDHVQGLREMHRVLKPDTGKVIVSGWSAVKENPACEALYESMAQLGKVTLADILQRHADNFSLSDVSVLQREMEQAGFHNVTCQTRECHLEDATLDQFVQMAMNAVRWRYTQDKSMPESKIQAKLTQFEEICRRTGKDIIEKNQLFMKANFGIGYKSKL